MYFGYKLKEDQFLKSYDAAAALTKFQLLNEFWSETKNKQNSYSTK